MHKELKKLIKIDHLNLHEEWVNHSANFNKILSVYNKKERDYKRKWEEVKTKKAELIDDYKFDNPKSTALQIEAHYRTDSEYKELKSEMNELEYEKNDLYSIVESFRHRKIALENIVELFGRQYFSDPKTPKGFETPTVNIQEKIAKRKRKRKNG
jgi:hypothetical protein